MHDSPASYNSRLRSTTSISEVAMPCLFRGLFAAAAAAAAAANQMLQVNEVIIRATSFYSSSSHTF